MPSVREFSRCWICIIAVRCFFAVLKRPGLLMNSRLAMVEARWMAKRSGNRRIDNRLESEVHSHNLASVDQFDVANFDLGTVFCLHSLILNALKFSLATNILTQHCINPAATVTFKGVTYSHMTARLPICRWLHWALLGHILRDQGRLSCENASSSPEA